MNKDFYIDLISKKLSSEISKDELQQLNHWLEESEENRELFKEFQDAWDFTEDFELDLNIDLDSEFASLQSKLEESSSNNQVEAMLS